MILTWGARLSAAFPHFCEVTMPSFNVAHLREQGQDMLLFPLDSGFGRKTSSDQRSILGELEVRAHHAGLAGRAAAVWESGGRTYTLGPPNWAGFLRSLSMRAVLANVNREISW
jgi:hypothetical protein